MSLPELWLWDTCPVLALQVSNAPIPDQEWSETTLPHQILLPDRAIWYAAKMSSTVNQYLYVSADDGAQIYFDGRQYPAINGYYYDLPEKRDSAWLLIRVLNNAMHGGLKNVKWVSKDSIDFIWSEQNSVLDQLEEIYLSDLYHSEVFLPKDNFRLHDRKSTKFTCWGDSQGGWDKFQALINQMLNIPRLEYSIGLGDLVADGSVTAQWFSFLTCLAPLIEKRVNIFPIVGNHDYDGYYDDLIPQNYLRHIANRFGSTYTSWSAGPAFFLVLDANHSFPLGLDSLQYQWATQKMLSQAWQKATWRFVLIHQPPYAQGWPGYQGDSFIRSFVDLHAETRRIDFVLSGHCHDFEYLQKQYGNQRTHFVITGGGGADLEPKENDELVRMDTIIKVHHYLLFDLDEKSATIQLIDDKNNVRWSNQVAASKP